MMLLFRSAAFCVPLKCASRFCAARRTSRVPASALRNGHTLSAYPPAAPAWHARCRGQCGRPCWAGPRRRALRLSGPAPPADGLRHTFLLILQCHQQGSVCTTASSTQDCWPTVFPLYQAMQMSRTLYLAGNDPGAEIPVFLPIWSA